MEILPRDTFMLNAVTSLEKRIDISVMNDLQRNENRINPMRWLHQGDKVDSRGIDGGILHR